MLFRSPVSRGNSRRSVVGGVTCRKTPISRPTLERQPQPVSPLHPPGRHLGRPPCVSPTPGVCPGIRFFSRVGREIGVFRHVTPPTTLRLEFPRETGLILRCAGNVGNPFRTKQGNRPSCLEQEGRRCSDEVVREPRCCKEAWLLGPKGRRERS